MKWIAAVVLAVVLGVVSIGGAAQALEAQTTQVATIEPAVALGFAFQSGRQLVRGVQHFPLGPRLGLGLQGPVGGGFDWGAAADISYYVQDATNRNGFVAPGPEGVDPDRSLLLGTAAIRLETPPVSTTSLFVAVGGAYAITTPRPGGRGSPMLEVGLHPKFDSRASVRIGYQYFLNRIGETRFQIPISFDLVL